MPCTPTSARADLTSSSLKGLMMATTNFMGDNSFFVGQECSFATRNARELLHHSMMGLVCLDSEVPIGVERDRVQDKKAARALLRYPRRRAYAPTGGVG